MSRSLVDAISRAGVKRIFTLSGNHIMPVFDAAIDAGIELIHVRHEAAAVHMADAWARLTGEIGVAMVTGGPGHANAVGALYTARMAESPVILLSGAAGAADMGRGQFQEMAQAEMAAPACKKSFTATSLARDFAEAVRVARSGRQGPVHLSLPFDLLEAKSDLEPGLSFDPANPPPPDVERVLQRLAKARRPLILAGPSFARRERTLEDATGVPVVVMESPRGVKDPSLGAFAEVLAQADLVLLLGKRLDFTLNFGKATQAAFIQVDPDEEEIARTRLNVGARLEAAWVGDPFAVPGRRIHDGSWLRDVRAALAYRPSSWDALPTARMLRSLQPLLDSHRDSVFVSDGGEIGQWAQACLTAPHRVINGVAGSIGAALPFALAARLAKPGAPVIAVMGDGTFGFHPAEIDTAVRYNLPFVLVVGNDARWNAEYQIQLRDYRRTVGTELLPARYDRVAEGFGGYGELVTDSSQVAAAATRAMQSGLPAVLNVMIEGLAAPNIKR